MKTPSLSIRCDKCGVTVTYLIGVVVMLECGRRYESEIGYRGTCRGAAPEVRP